jgi:hypothetical protein
VSWGSSIVNQQVQKYAEARLVPKAKTGTIDVRFLRRQAVQELWLTGHRQAEIAVILDETTAVVAGDIREFRETLYKDGKASQQEHAEQTVAIFRKVLAQLWILYEKTISVADKLKTMEQIRKTEESVAKIRGLVNSKVIADVFHHVKMYDFEDKLPGTKVIGESNKIIEGQAVTLPHLALPTSPSASTYIQETREHILPEYDSHEEGDAIQLPDGSWLELGIVEDSEE